MPESDYPTSNGPSPIRKRRLKRLLSVMAIVLCSGFFACAGCCFLGMVLLGPKNFDTPAGAEQIASEITPFTIPNSFTGESAALMDNFLVRFEIARFVHQQGRGNLVLGQFHYKLIPSVDLQPQLKEFVEKFTPDLKQLDITERESRDLTINGAPAKFEIGRGEDSATTTKYRQVIGHFKGKLNSAIVILECEDEFITDQEIDEFINSFH